MIDQWSQDKVSKKAIVIGKYHRDNRNVQTKSQILKKKIGPNGEEITRESINLIKAT